MLKSRSNFFGNLFYGKPCHKIRTAVYWTDVYPSPAPSWITKRVNAAGDWIYNSIDNFFQGSANRNIAVVEGNLFLSNKLSSTYIEWELNQDIVDIALIDIRSSFSWILPGFIKKIAFRLQHLAFLYLYTDLVNEKEFQELIELRDENIAQHEPDKSKVINTLQAIKDRIAPKCLSINDWLKSTYNIFKVFLRLEQTRKTYYLLGYFAPQGNEDPHDDQNYMIRGPAKVKLNPAFSFHKRI